MHHRSLPLFVMLAVLLIGLSPLYGQDASGSYLTVLNVSPQPGSADVEADNTRITLMFDRSVVLITLLSQDNDMPVVTIMPSVEGTGMWVHPAIYEFTPMPESLRGGTTYTVFLNQNLQAVDGAALEAPFQWSFTVMEPQVVEILPTAQSDAGVFLESAFTISFTQPMERASTEAAFTLYKNLSGACGDGCSSDPRYWEQVAGSFEWSDDDRQLTFTPAQRLDYSARMYDPMYRAVLTRDARNESGNASITADVQTYFSTVFRPLVNATTPIQGESVPPGMRQVTLDFMGRPDPESYRGHYTVTPTPPGEITPHVSEDGTLTLTFEHVLGETYTVTVLPGIRDVYGTETTEPFSFTYNVRERKPETDFWVVQPNYQFFVIAGTYLDDPALTLHATGDQEIALEIYRTNVNMLIEAVTQPFGYYGIGYGNPLSRLYAPGTVWGEYGNQSTLPYIPWIQPENLVNRSIHPLTIENPDGEDVHLPLRGVDDEPLPLGLYGVDVNGSAGFVLGVANSAVTVKRSYDELLVWVTDYVTTQPLTDMVVRVQGQSHISIGRTDAQGLVRFPAPAINSFLLITAESQDRFGAWYSAYGSSASGTTPYVYTDRPIYRPGETVYFRGILRDRDDLTYTIPGDTHLVYASLDSPCYDYFCDASDSIYQAELPITSFGTFSDSLTLPGDLTPGYYTIRISTCPAGDTDCRATYDAPISFQVGEFRVPDFNVEVTPQRDQAVSGEPINVDVFAAYYSGGAIRAGEVVRQARGRSIGFVYQGLETGFTFGDNEVTGLAEVYAPNEQLPIAEDGHYLLTDAPTVSGTLPVALEVEATVTDNSGQAISGRTSMILHPATVYIGLRPSTLMTDTNTPVSIDFMSIFQDSVPRPHQTIHLEIIERQDVRSETSFGTYEWHVEETLVTTHLFQTDELGRYTYLFNPPHPGKYRLRAQTTDQRGRSAQSAVTIIAGDAVAPANAAGDPFVYVGCDVGEPLTRLRIVPDQEQYVPGDIAELTFQNPYGVPVTALITLERQRILKEEVVSVSGDTYTYRLLLDGSDAPNVIMSVVLVRPTVLDTPLPVFFRGSVSVQVDNVERRLHIEVSPSITQSAPGDAVAFDLHVTDHLGEPVSAELGVSLTDQAALDVIGNYRATLEEHYYAQQYSNVQTSSSTNALLHSVAVPVASYCGRGGGGGSGQTALRDDFVYTPLWEPHLVTDDNGFGTVSLQMPDNLTQWRLNALAITSDTQVGEATTTITTSLPLAVRAVAPRFFVVGDQLPLVAIIVNDTDEPLSVTVTLEQQGFTLRDADTIQTINVGAHALQRVEWWGTVDDSDGVYMAVYAVADNGLTDASIPTLTTGERNTIPVYTFSTTDTLTFSGVLAEEGSQVESIDLRLDPVPESGRVSVEVAPDLAGSLLAGTENFTLSADPSILEMINSVRKNAALLNIEGSFASDTRPHLHEQIATALVQLMDAQNHDGGWGWYEGMASDIIISSDALIALHDAVAQGFRVDDAAVDSALNYVVGHIVLPSVNTPVSELDLQATLLYTLSIHGRAEREWLDRLFDERLELSIAARAQLLLAYLNTAPEAEQRSSLLTDLTSRAIISGTSVHWEETDDTYSPWSRNTQTTTLALFALLRAEPNHPLAANAIRWLVTANQGDPERALGENLWMTSAVSEWLRQTGDAVPDYVYTVAMNSSRVLEGQFNDERQSPQRWTMPLEMRGADQVSTIAVERTAGSGTLYYEGQLALTYAAQDVAAASRSIRIEREYVRDFDQQPVSSLSVGDVVVIRITLYVSQDLYYFTLEDTLPAGLEPLDPLLLTTMTQAQSPRLRSTDRNNPYWYWGALYWGRTQIYDTGITLQARYLPRGVYTYTYQARAATPGEFLIPPALAYAAQQPDIMGRTEPGRMSIQGQ